MTKQIKLGICNEIFKDWNNIKRTMKYVKELGYDGIEIAPFTISQYVTDIPLETRKEIKQLSEQIGLEVAGIHWVFVGPENVYLTHPDPEIRNFTAHYLKELVHFCADIGGKIIVFGSPKQRNVQRNISYNQAFEYACEVFSQAMPICEERDVTLCIEQLTHWETNFCHTIEETIELIEAIDHPKFQLILDTKAMTFLQEPRETIIRKCAKYLKHYHANDENLLGPGMGKVDFGPIIKALKDINYSGYISVEVFKFDLGPEKIATESINYLKKFLDT
ncbi:MAG TPA: sugar phosphate isomerase/epimerase family protein [Candidatus Hydrogenedens sp.]|nr:sugar phosphate isomerase/epimerase [Candidatus Hydrogenedens sp.]HOK08087.1 sugar phosphate isomerase/epimerase family protein [Candidatus Hydrogenedens sp.]HOL19319.1 sugar phosphate isomerase/epimerase family protein [Candidatus Hydrogenedens sp.]HPP57919.1 sugar phosphate isomerase/epimerase family protein [Candidatus Hydrogenedens sp.]